MKDDALHAVGERAWPIVLAKQPILDDRGALFAHELLFRDAQGTAFPMMDDVQATAAVVERAIGVIGLDRLSPSHACFLNCSTAFLASPAVRVLPAQRFVLEILETCVLDQPLRSQCERLRLAGFRLALDDVIAASEELVAFLPWVDIVKVDWLHTRAPDRVPLVRLLKAHGKTVLAEKIETRAERDEAFLAGCDLFQGYYFSKPQSITAKRVAPHLDAVLDVMRLLIDGECARAVAQHIERCPVLTVQLLRLANSGATPRGMARPIESIAHALTIVGTDRMLCWCGLLLYATSLPAEQDPLVDLALQRAAVMEALLAMRSAGETLVRQGKLVGLLSLVHVSYGVTPRELWEGTALCRPVTQALTHQGGALGEVLAQVISLEA